MFNTNVLALDRLADRLSRVSGWWPLATLAVFAIFIATVLPWQASISASYTGAAPAPDTSRWYTAADLYAAAEAWGPEGRSKYVVARLSFDVVWPLVYGSFLVTSLAWLGARTTRPGSRWRCLSLLPVMVVLLDYAENLCTAIVMARYPAPTPVLADLAGPFTAAKWALLLLSFLLLAIAVVAAVLTRVRRSSAATGTGPPRRW